MGLRQGQSYVLAMLGKFSATWLKGAAAEFSFFGCTSVSAARSHLVSSQSLPDPKRRKVDGETLQRGEECSS